MKKTVISLILIFLFSLSFCLFEDNFVSFNSGDWSVEVGSSVLTYGIAFDSNCLDNYCLELRMPSGYNLSGPAKGINILSRVRYGYGRYRVRMKSAYGGEDAGVVSAFFTYFNDYWSNSTNFTDLNNNGISDNSEIDIELLSREPTVIYMTVWTDYDEVGGTVRFRKITRKINLATGDIYQTPYNKENTYELERLQERFQPTILDFNHTQNFYEYSFEWSSSSVKFYVTISGTEILLWDMDRKELVPKNEAYIMVNLWHNSTQWDNGQLALAPSVNCVMKVDKISFCEIDKEVLTTVKNNYILYLNKPNHNIVSFGKVREVKIFDVKGNLIRTIIDPPSIYNLYDRSKYSEKLWDGKDKNGKYVVTGIYLYQVEDESIRIGTILVLK